MHYSSFIVAALAAVASARPLKHSGAIKQHNFYRKQHSAPPMKWDTNLEAEAKAWTDQCIWDHHTDGYGQNLYMSSAEHPLSEAVDSWYSEEGDYASYYGQATGPYSHFTQVVWVGSTQLGCYTTHCPTLTNPDGEAMSGYFTACNYLEAGNMSGDFADNVLPPTNGSY